MPKPRPHSRSKRDTRGSPQSPDRGASFQELEANARECHTPKQFCELLERLKSVIPYEQFAGIWGHPSQTIRYIFHKNMPTDFLRWYLTKGALWTSPLFQEWVATNKSYLWCDAAERLRTRFAPEVVVRMEKAGMKYMLCGGFANEDHFVLLVAAMPSEESGRRHLKQFDSIIPFLVDASQRAYPRALLTDRETAILERRAKGEILKQIAAVERISERTIREHLQNIKKKLCTDDLVNAVVIAVKGGMVIPDWKGRTKGN